MTTDSNLSNPFFSADGERVILLFLRGEEGVCLIHMESP